MISRDITEQIVGKTFADAWEDRVLTLGKRTITRRELVEEFGCPNFAAARRLDKALKAEDITSIKELVNTNPVTLLAHKGVGEATMFVALSLVWCGAGGDPEVWWLRHNAKGRKVNTVKQQARRRKS